MIQTIQFHIKNSSIKGFYKLLTIQYNRTYEKKNIH